MFFFSRIFIDVKAIEEFENHYRLDKYLNDFINDIFVTTTIDITDTCE